MHDDVDLFVVQDRIQLSQVVSSLTEAQSKDSLIEPEYYQYLLLLLLKVGKVNKSQSVSLCISLCQFVSVCITVCQC